MVVVIFIFFINIVVMSSAAQTCAP